MKKKKQSIYNKLRFTYDPVILESFGKDLTFLARTNKLDEYFGREEELKNLIEILLRRYKSNPILIGESGVGKTGLIEMFAQKVVKKLVPVILQNRIIIKLDTVKIAAEAKAKSKIPYEFRFQKFYEKVLCNPNVILFIDDIHNILGTENTNAELIQSLKPLFFHKAFQCIGTTNPNDYKNIFEKDQLLFKKFQPLIIKEPSLPETLTLLNQTKYKLEHFHNVEILPEAVKSAIDLSSKYITDKYLPEKAIDLLDRAASHEVYNLTKINKDNLIISSIINEILIKLEKIRLICFKNKDITSEFIFQEIENIYKNFYLRWLKSPLNVKTKSRLTISPITNKIFNNIKFAILKDIDKLLLSSPNLTTIETTNKKYKNLSYTKNKLIFKEFYLKIKNKKKVEISLYRISLLILISWITKNKNLIFNYKKLNLNIFNLIIKLIKKKSINKEDIYNNNDFEFYKLNITKLSEKDYKHINIFKQSLENLKPIIKKSLKNLFKEDESSLQLEKNDLKNIYSLLNNSFKINLDLVNKFNTRKLKKQITETDIKNLISTLTNIPLNTVSQEEITKLMNLEAILHKRVIGQEEAISAIAKAIRRARFGVQNPNRPLASFFFCGPTGVGKTEVTKTLAEVMFGSEKEIIRFDMSEFMEKFNISRLIGSPPGYIGYEEGGQLTESVKRKPYSVVLFDEIEKAHPEVLNILLQVLEDGHLTDNKKQTINFHNTIIVMTSNAAASTIQEYIFNKPNNLKNNIIKNNTNKDIKNSINEYSQVIKFFKSPTINNFLNDIKLELQTELQKYVNNKSIIENIEKENTEKKDPLKEKVFEALTEKFLPEFLNRIDNIIIFQPLKIEDLYLIFDIIIANLNKRLKAQKITLLLDDNVKLKICKEGNDPKLGARPLRRLITNYVEDLITDYLLKNPLDLNPKILKVVLDNNNKIIIK